MKVFILLCLTTLIYAKTPKLLFIGDSLTAGFGLATNQAFPALVEQKLGTENIMVINAGSSGDTTFSLLNRLEWTMNQVSPNIVFFCIGANDGLRGFDLSVTQTNIEKIINKLRSYNVKLYMAGITLPKNYSDDYIKSFEQLQQVLATKNDIPYLPFLLTGVAGVPELNLADKIHPNELGHELIAETVYEFLVSNNILENNVSIDDTPSLNSKLDDFNPTNTSPTTNQKSVIIKQ